MKHSFWIGFVIGLGFVIMSLYGGTDEIRPWQVYASFHTLVLGALYAGFFQHEGSEALKSARKPTFELAIMAIATFLISGGLFWFTMDNLDHTWAVLLVITMITGLFLIAILSEPKTLLGLCSSLLAIELFLFPFCICLGLVLAALLISKDDPGLEWGGLFQGLSSGLNLMLSWVFLFLASSIPTYLIFENRIARRIASGILALIGSVGLWAFDLTKGLEISPAWISVLFIPTLLYSVSIEILLRQARIKFMTKSHLK